jgi:ABC-2 type transport system ATP-binding protein
MNAVVVEARGLQKTFGRQQVLRGVDWQLPRGTVVGLLGRNGAGKSTLLECLLGLRETDAGSATLFGEAVTALSEAARARIGYVPQQPEAFEWLTPVQMLEYFRALYPRWNDARVEGLLQRWGFGGELRTKPIGRLSGGEKQRLAIIRALAHEPELLVLDEPVASLDPVGRREFLRELIGTVADDATTVVFSTHILSDLERVALDVAVLHDGRIGLQAPLDELLEGARRITGPAAALDALALRGELRRERHAGGSVTVVARLSGAELERLRTQPGLQADTLSLEDLFVEVTK